MEGSIIFVFVEGPDDKTFFEKIVEPRIAGDIDKVEYFEYSEEHPEYIEDRIRGLESDKMPDHVDYIFLTDRDDCEDKESSIEEITENYPEISQEKVKVVVIEIESWYFAGLDQDNCKKLNIPYFKDTSNKNKEEFKSRLPEKLYTSSNFKTSFLNNITTKFNVKEAKKTNDSFKEFCQYIDL